MTKNRILAALAALLLSAGVARAAPPTFFTYSGFLTDGAGAPLSGAQTFHFRFYNDPSAGTALGAGEIAVPTTVGGDGFFSVVIDVSGLTSDPLFQSQLYMAVRVDPDAAAMSPRIQVTSVPSALAVPYSGITGFPTTACPADQYATGFDAAGAFVCAALPPSGGGTTYTGLAPVTVTGSQISMAAANGTTSGYLTNTDWATFNAKQPALTGACGPGTYLVGIDTTTGAPSCSAIGTGEITSGMLADGAVTGAKIADGSVTLAKLGASGCAAGSVISWEPTLGWVCSSGVQSLVASADLTVNGIAGGTLTGTGTVGLSDTGVTPGTYNIVSIDAKGRVISANAIETVWLQNGPLSYQIGELAVTGNVSTLSSFVGNLSGNASSASVASSVTSSSIVPSSLSASVPPGLGQVPATNTVGGFDWITPVAGASDNTFTGINTFTNAGSSYAGDGSLLSGLNASNLASGTVPSATVSGAYPNITEVGPQANLSLAGDMDAAHNVIRRIVPGMAVQTVAYTNTTELGSGTGGALYRYDGVVEINSGGTAANSWYQVQNRSGYSFDYAGPGSFLSFRANSYYIGGTGPTDGQMGYVLVGGCPFESGGYSGGYGFRFRSTATTKLVEGVTVAYNGGLNVALQLADLSVSGIMHKYFAVNRGTTIEFFIDGVSAGSVSTSNMNASTQSTYCLRVETPAAVNASMGIAQLAVGQGM